MRRYLQNIPRTSLSSFHSRAIYFLNTFPSSQYSTTTPSTESQPEIPYDELSSYAKLRHDLKLAMREKDMKTVNTVKSVLTDHNSTTKELKHKMPDTPEQEFQSDNYLAPIIHRQISKRLDSLEGYKEYHRHDLVEKEQFEIDVLKRYLPQPQTTEQEVREMVIEAAETLRESGRGANDPGSMGIGKIMKWIMSDIYRKERLGRVWADQRMVKRVVAETVRELSDRPDGLAEKNVARLQKREKDDLTKPRYQ